MIEVGPIEIPDFHLWILFIVLTVMSAVGFAKFHKNKLHIEAVGAARYVIPGKLAILALVTLDVMIKFTGFIK